MAGFTEEQVYEAFGLEQGAQEQEVAAPASDPAEQTGGENGQEVAEPAQGADDGDGVQTEPTAGEAGPDEAVEDPQTEKPPQTPEQRRENAARRRREEEAQRQAQIDQAVQAARAQEQERFEARMKDLFQRAGLKNTITGEPITNMEQFDSWHQQFQQARLQRELKAGKLTPEGLASAIGEHPIVKQAQELIQQDADRRKQQENREARANIDAEIAQIHELDASISTLEDLTKAPYWPQLYQLTRKGYSIKDAHFLLNYERLEKAKLEAAKQQGMNNARSKDHMTGVNTPRGGGAVSVPHAEMAMFRLLNPTASDAEIQAFYNQYKKR